MCAKVDMGLLEGADNKKAKLSIESIILSGIAIHMKNKRCSQENGEVN